MPIIILSPSKTMNHKTVPSFVKASQARHLDDATIIMSAINRLGNKTAKVLGVSQSIVDANITNHNSWKKDAHKNAQPAVYAFSGDVYNGLNILDFSEQDMERAQKSLRIISGLYGVLRPLDSILPYRLEMKTRLKGKWGSGLYDFWGARLAQEIESEMPNWILVCASNEYSQAVVGHIERTPVITPIFLQDGKQKGLFSKYGRGLLAAWVIKNNIQNSEDLKLFSEEGFRFVAKDSTETTAVFAVPQNFTLLGRFKKK